MRREYPHTLPSCISLLLVPTCQLLYTYTLGTSAVVDTVSLEVRLAVHKVNPAILYKHIPQPLEDPIMKGSSINDWQVD
ncbi:hypothetical protein F5Y17DRAFT_18886 [Xylariaceae sp. FL0594]|nr:hypothetical protein F5Y17DRAFT_18886 [Xylariaceae sp. FL0594]